MQKERDHNQEAKRKTEEMKAKLYTLRTQKMELERKILEMQSTISSLKDEQRTLESGIEEKQNEIKLLRGKEAEISKENPLVLALTETLKQKDAEIEDLKHRFEYPDKVWSVSSDDPSNLALNSTKDDTSGLKESNVRLNESTRFGDFENSSTGGDESLNESITYRDGDRREDSVSEDSQKLENSRDEVRKKKTKDAQKGEGKGLAEKEEKKTANGTETITNQGDQVSKSEDAYSNTKTMDGNGTEKMENPNSQEGEGMDGKEQDKARTAKMENPNSQEGEGRELGTSSRGGMKMEMPIHRMRGKHDYTVNPKEKKWRILAKSRKNSGNDKGLSTRGRQFHGTQTHSGRYKRIIDDELQKLEGHRGDQNMGLNMKDEINGVHEQEGENLEMKKASHFDSRKPKNSQGRENESSEGADDGVQQELETKYASDQNSEEAKGAQRYEETEDVDAGETQEADR